MGEEVCREFRIGYAPGGGQLTGRARQEGYSQEELLAVGLANRRGNDYFQRRIVFPLTDARGRVRGFQARKLHDDDPMQAKYINSPEGELFRKGDLLYGLDTARTSIAKENRAVIVEGNTDVLALRQAGFAPVVASMGTALTEAQLRELARLTKRLFLCFDSDAAGQDATLRGMELAVRDGFSVRVVPLPQGTDPADDPTAFEERLASPVSYPVHRVRLEHARATDPQAAFASIRAFLTSLPDSPEHLEAIRVAADLLDLPPETQAGLAPARGSARTAGVVSPRLLDAGQRLERSALAGVAAHETLRTELEEIPPEFFRRRSAPPRARVPAREGERRRRADLTSRRALRDQPRPTASPRRRRGSSSCGCASADSGANYESAEGERKRELLRGTHEAPGRDPDARLMATAVRGYNGRRRSPVAQLAEHSAVNRRVVGSSPTRGAS